MRIRTVGNTYQVSTSLFEQMIAAVYGFPHGVVFGFGAIFVAVPFVIAFLQGDLTFALRNGTWRNLLEPTAICIYAIVSAPVMLQSELKIVQSMRPIVELDDDKFRALLADASRVRPRSELAAIAVGVAAGLVVSKPQRVLAAPTVLSIYLWLLLLLQFGLMAWWVFVAFTNTQVTSTLQRQPLDIDIFDVGPFEPIGTQSLILAILFIGGFALSLLIGFVRTEFFSWQTIAVYAVFVLLAVLLFAFNMRHTHRRLLQTKQQELAIVGARIVRAYREMKRVAVGDEETQTLSADINAWLAMEERLKLTRTWPYNTEMLRTLFISTLLPLFVGLSKLAGVLLVNRQM